MMRLFRSLFIISIVLFFQTGVFPDSIWERTSSSPYTVSKAFKVGDIVTIIIIETTSAVHKSGSDSSVSDNLSASFDHTMQSLGLAPSNSITGSLGNSYKGLGSTSRTSNVTAKVAAIVTEVLPNGNVKISGEHRVEVNNEIQIVTIKGIVRPKDVSLSNTIYSYQVASADVSIKGSGSVEEAGSPGWLTRIFNWLF